LISYALFYVINVLEPNRIKTKEGGHKENPELQFYVFFYVLCGKKIEISKRTQLKFIDPWLKYIMFE